MTVLTFMPQFHGHVRSGRKPHTIRPVRKRPIKSGERLSLRGWSGRPYCSPQFVLREEWCTYAVPVFMRPHPAGVDLMVAMGSPWTELRREDCEGLAYADGFDYSDHGTPWETMKTWFLANHGKALLEGFHGILIGWETPDWLVKMAADGRDPRDTGLARVVQVPGQMDLFGGEE